MDWKCLVVVTALAVGGCGRDAGDRIEAPADASPEDVAASDVVAEENRLITEIAIGPFSPGMTFEELRAAEASFDYVIVESDARGRVAVCAREDGVDVVCGVAARLAAVPGASVVTRVETGDERFRTRQGVAAGTPLSAAAEVYGEAFVVLADDAGAVEVAEFDRGPGSNIIFEVRSPSSPDGLAGVYDEDETDFRETERFRDDTVISMIVVTPTQR